MCQQLDADVSIHIYLHEIDLTNQARSFFDLFADDISSLSMTHLSEREQTQCKDSDEVTRPSTHYVLKCLRYYMSVYHTSRFVFRVNKAANLIRSLRCYACLLRLPPQDVRSGQSSWGILLCVDILKCATSN
jgi:hypothetical protein